MASEVIENPLDMLPEIQKTDLNRNLCVCNEVKLIDVTIAIANGAKTLEQVREKT